MTDFGYNTIATAGNDDTGPNWIWIKATSTPASNGTLTSIQGYCSQNGVSQTTGSSVDFALYSDSSGVPSALLATAATPVAVGASFAWVTQTGFSFSVVAGTQYWFGIRDPNNTISDNDTFFKFDTNGSVIEGYFKDGSGGTGNAPGAFPATVTSPTSFTNERWSVYGTYTPAGGGLPPGLGPSLQMGEPFQFDTSMMR